MALDKIKTAMIEDDAVTADKVVPVTAAMIAADVATTASVTATTALVTAAELDADKIQTNLAILAFKTASNGSLAKYNLQDQIIDEYVNATGVNAGDSTNETLTSGVYSGSGAVTPTTSGGTSTTHGDNTLRTITATGSTNFITDVAITAEILIVAGGGSGGGAGISGGGGGGQVLHRTGVSLAAGTYAAVVGVGGVVSGLSPDSGNVSSLDIDGVVSANGGGHGASYNVTAADTSNIGSGGGGGGTDGANYPAGAASDATTPTGWTSYVQSGGSGEGDGATGAVHVGGGGGGATVAGTAGANASGGGNGGNGVSIANMGPSGATYSWAAGGGGGTYAGTAGAGGTGGGGGGGHNQTPSSGGAAGTGGIGTAQAGQVDESGGDGGANTGSGGGGGANDGEEGGNGGSGIVIIKFPTSATAASDLILQSSDTTAEAAPTKADIVMLVEDAGSGVASLNTGTNGLQAYISMYETGGTKTWTQATLTDEGDWGTDKRILVAHDVTLTGTSGTQMAYKITTHNASAVYDTKIHATSIGWR